MSLRGVMTPASVGVMTDTGKIKVGDAVSYTDEEGGEWAAVVIQEIGDGKWDIRLADAKGHQRVVAHEDDLEAW